MCCIWLTWQRKTLICFLSGALVLVWFDWHLPSWEHRSQLCISSKPSDAWPRGMKTIDFIRSIHFSTLQSSKACNQEFYWDWIQVEPSGLMVFLALLLRLLGVHPQIQPLDSFEFLWIELGVVDKLYKPLALFSVLSPKWGQVGHLLWPKAKWKNCFAASPARGGYLTCEGQGRHLPPATASNLQQIYSKLSTKNNKSQTKNYSTLTTITKFPTPAHALRGQAQSSRGRRQTAAAEKLT